MIEENNYNQTHPFEQESTNFASHSRMCRRLARSRDARAEFVESHINKGLAHQLRAMREDRQWSQEDVAKLADMPQTAISRLESPSYGKPTITTLKRLAKVYDVALVVRFVPFSKLAQWASGTPYIEKGLSSDAIAVPSFEEEEHAGVFSQQQTQLPAVLKQNFDSLLNKVNGIFITVSGVRTTSPTSETILDQYSAQHGSETVATLAAGLPVPANWLPHQANRRMDVLEENPATSPLLSYLVQQTNQKESIQQNYARA